MVDSLVNGNIEKIDKNAQTRLEYQHTPKDQQKRQMLKI